MKKVNYGILILLLISVFLMVSSCANNAPESNLWETATYTEDTELGTGDKTITVQVMVEDKSVNFTISTDYDILADALLEHDLISGEQEQYGLYVKEVNGIIADYNINKSYWSLTKNGDYMQTGVSQTQINDAEHYELVYTK